MSENHHIRPYEKLIVWRESHILCLRTYELTTKFPKHERFRLVDQMCRSAYSAPMNIAEGNMKISRKEKRRYFEIALGSIEELHYQMFLARDLHYITPEEFKSIDDHIQRVSYLLTKLRSAFSSVASVPSVSLNRTTNSTQSTM